MTGWVSLSWMTTFSGNLRNLVKEQEAAQDIAQRAGDKEIFLLQAQLAALGGIVVGIEHLADIFGVRFSARRRGHNRRRRKVGNQILCWRGPSTGGAY